MSEPLRFSRVQLKNWKNFAQCDVRIAGRVFLVGPNASGKSNFLDAFRFLRDLASDGGGFSEAVRRRRGVGAIRCLAARQEPEVEIRVTAETRGPGSQWQYLLAFNQNKARRRPEIIREKVLLNGKTLLERPTDTDRKDPELLKQTNLEQTGTNKDFRELVSFLASIQYLHIVPQLVRDPDRSVGRPNDPFGGDFLDKIARTPKARREARLRKIKDALSIAVPKLAEIKLEPDSRGTQHLLGKYEHWRPQGAWQNEEQFSDGTLRLMGLLWVSMETGGPLLLEEPELSLHSEIVRYLPQMFARVQRRTGRQFLISTHSPDLLSDEGIALDEVLLLRPGGKGTEVTPASEFEEIPALLSGGSTLADAIVPKTRPDHAEQIALFGDK